MNAIVLAGGKSSRFGSNKALYKINQRPMLINIIEKLNPFFDQVYVVGNNKNDYENIDNINYLVDKIPNKGPLGGLYTGLKKSDCTYNYLQACDMPFINKEYIIYLKKYVIKKRGYDAYIPEKNGYLEPFAGIYNKNITKKIYDLIKNEKLNFDYLYDIINLKIIKEEEINKQVDIERIFFNINKKNDLKKYKKIKAK